MGKNNMLFLIKKECEFIKMDNKKLLLMEKTIYSKKRQRLLKLMILIRFPASKSSGIEKMWFFNWDCLSHCRSLWNSLIFFLFVSQF